MNVQLSVALLIFIATIALSLFGLFGSQQFIERNLFRPYWFLRKQQYLTAISSGFLHADVWHLVFNMLTFYFFAFGLERRIGGPKFFILYFAGLLVSHLGTWYKQRDNPDYASLGASGAISAVLFASILYNPSQSLLILPIPIPIPAPLFAIGYLAYTWYSARNSRARINHDAHLGGALTGLAYIALMDPRQYVDFFRNLF
jgi:membrane associated rhomboid family serine protease